MPRQQLWRLQLRHPAYPLRRLIVGHPDVFSAEKRRGGISFGCRPGGTHPRPEPLCSMPSISSLLSPASTAHGLYPARSAAPSCMQQITTRRANTTPKRQRGSIFSGLSSLKPTKTVSAASPRHIIVYAKANFSCPAPPPWASGRVRFYRRLTWIHWNAKLI